MKFKLYWNYFKYILEHKWNVFKTCWSQKLYIHGITHDLSKFSYKEFPGYAEWFYGENGVKLKKDYNEEQLTNGMSCLSNSYLKTKELFNEAWEHHYENNPHHWEYWIDLLTGDPKPIPEKFLKQMIADWEGMALKFGDTAQKYYLNNYNKIKLEYNTRLRLEYELNLNESMAHNYGNILEDFVKMYDEQTYDEYFGLYIKERYGIDSYKLLKQIA